MKTPRWADNTWGRHPPEHTGETRVHARREHECHSRASLGAGAADTKEKKKRKIRKKERKRVYVVVDC